MKKDRKTKALPYTNYPDKDNEKRICRICGNKLLPPRKPKVLYTKKGKVPADATIYFYEEELYNHTCCSFDCLAELYNDSEDLINNLY